MILEELYHCTPDSIILLNYTYNKGTRSGLGYGDVLEKIESNSNTLVTIYEYNIKNYKYLILHKM